MKRTFAILCVAMLVAFLFVSCDSASDSGSKKAEEETYTVTFDSDGGKPDYEASKVKKGAAVAKPATDPTKENFIFKGWYKNDTEYNFSDPVTESFTLKALWVPVPTAQDFLESYGMWFIVRQIGNDRLLSVFSTDKTSEQQTVEITSEAINSKQDGLKEALTACFTDNDEVRYLITDVRRENSRGTISVKKNESEVANDVFIILKYKYQTKENETWKGDTEKDGMLAFSYDLKTNNESMTVTIKNLKSSLKEAQSGNLPDISSGKAISYKPIIGVVDASGHFTKCVVDGIELSSDELAKVNKALFGN